VKPPSNNPLIQLLFLAAQLQLQALDLQVASVPLTQHRTQLLALCHAPLVCCHALTGLLLLHILLLLLLLLLLSTLPHQYLLLNQGQHHSTACHNWYHCRWEAVPSCWRVEWLLLQLLRLHAEHRLRDSAAAAEGALGTSTLTTRLTSALLLLAWRLLLLLHLPL
jgi:hypothetical protein